MKNDQQPENEAWRRRREEELRARQPEPWYARQTREDRVGDGVAPMRPPTVPVIPASAPHPASAPPSRPAAPADTVQAKSGLSRPASPTLTKERTTPTLTGTVGRPSAIIAALLLAVAAGWQARDMFAPAPPPRPSPVVAEPGVPALPAVVSAPHAPASPRVVAQQCDAPAVIDGLRASIAADVRRDGGDAAWSSRVAGETEVAIAPQVTTIGSDGTRFCAAKLTLIPPSTTGVPRPVVTPVTYSTGAPDDRRGPVFGLQGEVSAVAALVALGQPPKVAALPKPADASASPVVKPQPVKSIATPKRTQLVVKSPPAVAIAAPTREPVRPPPEESASRPKAASAPASVSAPVASSIAVASIPAARNACADAVSRAEAMICASPSLGHLDRRLNITLDRVQSSGDERLIDKVDSGQRRFLARRDRCTDGECIAGRITDRLDDIARIEAKQAGRQDELVRKAASASSRVLPQCKGFELYRPTRPCRVGR